MNCPTCSTPMKDLFSGQFCPNDCDRPKAQVAVSSDWKTELLRHVKPLSRKTITWSGWLDCEKFVLTGRPDESTYCFFPEVDVKFGGMNPVGMDDIRRADWVVHVENGKITVLKNRWGRNVIEDLPVYE